MNIELLKKVAANGGRLVLPPVRKTTLDNLRKAQQMVKDGATPQEIHALFLQMPGTKE